MEIDNIRKVLIYPAYNARYYDHFVDAVLRVVGRRRVRFSSVDFPRFGTDCLAVRIFGEREGRLYLHADDSPRIAAAGWEWCDVFGKVNLDPERVLPKGAHKIVAMGPTFPFRSSGLTRTAARAVNTYIRSRGDSWPLRSHLSTYRGVATFRFQERDYLPGQSRSDYVFFNGSLWEREPSANRVRANFVEAAASIPDIRFEGGLSARGSKLGTAEWRPVEYEKLLVDRIPNREHLEKTKRSAVAFNNPAYQDCHSWRLAESLALGKAIISTPIKRALPAPLIHGRDIHFVDGSVESIRTAIIRICSDVEYQRGLERNARRYYDRHLHPDRVVRRLLAALSTEQGKGEGLRGTEGDGGTASVRRPALPDGSPLNVSRQASAPRRPLT